jgi:predicted nucleic acid-binding Zn ribbon protein
VTTVTRGVWGTQWKVEKELRDSPGLAFVRRYLSFYDFSQLEWITLRRSLRWSYLDVWPCGGSCWYPWATSSGLFRINATVVAAARYPAEVRFGDRDSSGKLQPNFLNDENEAVVAIIAHEVSHYLGSTGQVPAYGRVHSSGIQSTSEAQANEFMKAAVEAYRRSIGDATSSNKLLRTLGPLARVGWCVVCGKSLSKGGGSHSFCSDRCRWTYHNRQRRARIAAGRGKMECEVCGAEFTPTRNDAKTCSPACRQKKYRKLRKDRTDLHERV